ncbi:acetylornithine deacetylase [Planktotalea sp.]|uniref:acetylornithine deacetylase n=1 Tax=Planktotalea sp. TaxID=2029877 RepID=UPI003D6B882A
MTRTLEILDRLVGFPTVSRDSNLDLIEYVQGLLEAAGFDVTRISGASGIKAGLYARIGPKIDGGLCLSAHTDVVPVDGQDWTRPPFSLTDEGSRVFGRGTTDMKGFLASALALAGRVNVNALDAPLSFSISYDEEIGCVGMQEMMPQLMPLLGKPRLVVVGEPTSMQVAIGHKGKTALDVICHGQAGHSALAPQFTNAIYVAADFVQGVRALQEQLALGPSDADYSVPYSTVHVGRISGGQALNIVPADAKIEMEFRHLSDTPASVIVEKLEAIAKRVDALHKSATPITLEQVNAYPGLNTDPHDPAVDWVRSASGGNPLTKVPFGTEAGFFSELGLSTVVIGPGDMATDGHKPDEGLCKSELAKCDTMLDNLVSSIVS